MVFVLLGLYVDVALVIKMYKSEDHYGDNSLSDTGDCDASDGDNYIYGIK